jgi:hypothetical protein
VFTWTHNPADGTPQSKYQLQYKVDAGSYVTVGPTTSGTSSYTLPATTITNGHTITWHVATAGANGILSAYSADATFTTSDRPTATLSTPGASYTSSHLVAAWTYYQAQSSPQATWQAVLLDASNNVLESHSGTSETTAAFDTVLADATTYKVQVYVTSAAGLTSLVAQQTFTVTYLPPAAVHVDATYDSGSGCMVLVITGDDPVGGSTVDIDTVSVQRSINGGPWVTLASGLMLVDDATTVLDTTPTIWGTNTYRAVALSSLPSSATSAEEVVPTAESRWCYLSAGPGFATIVRMLPLPTGQGQPSRDRALYHFADRQLPVMLQGQAIDMVVTAGATLSPDSSTRDEVEAMGTVTGPALWRDLTGRRVYGAVSVSTGRSNKRYPDVSLTITQIDHTE